MREFSFKNLFHKFPVFILFGLAASLLPIQAVNAATIGGLIFAGQQVDGHADITTAAPLLDAKVMVQNQHSGGVFITYGVVTGHSWSANVGPGDYVVMFSAAGHDSTSREFTVDAADVVTNPAGSGATQDAYLPPLFDLDGEGVLNDLPRANLLVYSFMDYYVNGEDDGGDEDPVLNGATWTVCPEDGLPEDCQTGVSGAQSPIIADDGIVICDNAVSPGACDGYVYFTGLPPGEVIASSDPTTATSALNPHITFKNPNDATREYYLMTSEEGGHAWDPKLYPGDPGTEDGTYLLWHGYVEKLGQYTGGNPALASTISGYLLDADGNDPDERFPNPGPPGVSPNTIVPDGFVVLFSNAETQKVVPIATTEADPITGFYRFENVPPGNYKLFVSDVPIDYVWTQQQVIVYPGIPSYASPLAPRFFARGHGHVYDNSTTPPTPIEGATVHIRYKSGSIKRTRITDADGWYNFDNLPEIEVLGHVDVELPDGYRGAMVTDTFNYNLPGPYEFTHNAMNRYIQWLTANYQADLYVEPIPAGEGDIRGFVFNDHFATGTWVGDGSYDSHEERTLHGVTVELWNLAGDTLIATTTTGKVDKAQIEAQGWHQPYTMPPDELGGVYVGPMPGFYEFRGLPPGDYSIRVLPPAGFSPSPAGSSEFTLALSGGASVNHDFGMNTRPDPLVSIGVPLAGEIEGGVFDDVNIDSNPASLLFLEKAGIPGVPVGVYDHLGYFLGAGFMGNPLCYEGSIVCPTGEEPIQKPEMERRFAPGVHIYIGNDPSLPGYNPNYLPLALAYQFGQGKYKFEADWSLIPVSASPTPLGGAMLADTQILPDNAPVIDDVQPVGSYLVTGTNFGDKQAYSTVTLAGQKLKVISWSDTEIHVDDPRIPISGWLTVATSTGISNAIYVDVPANRRWQRYLAKRSVFVGPGGDYATIGEALDNLPNKKPRYVFVAPGTYNEHFQIKESHVKIIGSGPRQTIINGRPGRLNITAQGFDSGTGPVIYIGKGGEDGGVKNITISGLTITGGTVKDDIGAGIFGDYGNQRIDINNSIIVRNGGYYGGGIWLHLSNHDVKIWSNIIAENGNVGGYGGGISVNDEPEYGPEHEQPEHVVDDPCPPTCEPPGTYNIFNNLIYHNWSPDYGGGITMYEVKDRLKIYGNMILENRSEDHGGGAFFEDTGPIELYGNVFLRNFCYDDGGAVSFEDVGDHISTVDIYNNLFAQNIADDHGESHARGGALAFDDTFYASVYNNTIVGNIVAGSYTPAGGGIDSERNGHEYNGADAPLIEPGFSDPKIYNNIIWNNWRLIYEQPGGEEEDLNYTWGLNYVWTRDDLHVDNPNVQEEWDADANSESFSYVKYNDISDGTYQDNRLKNMNLDPQFVDPLSLDWHLTAGSPVIDQAKAKLAPKYDLERLLRSVKRARVDMGAYEFHAVQPSVIRIPEGILGAIQIPVTP